MPSQSTETLLTRITTEWDSCRTPIREKYLKNKTNKRKLPRVIIFLCIKVNNKNFVFKIYHLFLRQKLTQRVRVEDLASLRDIEHSDELELQQIREDTEDVQPESSKLPRAIISLFPIVCQTRTVQPSALVLPELIKGNFFFFLNNNLYSKLFLFYQRCTHCILFFY